MTQLSVRRLVLYLLFSLLTLTSPGFSADPDLLFVVIMKVSKDRKQVMAQVSSGSTTGESALIPADNVQDNPIWKKLEICHALRAEGFKVAEGYRLVSVKAIDAGMLPMSLQGIAGDCLIKKAIEFAPLVD